MENMCKEELFKLIQETNFAVIELALYLDTHPECSCALETYHEYHHTLLKDIDVYQRRFDPITIYGVHSDECWTWGKEPWPWQKGCDC